LEGAVSVAVVGLLLVVVLVLLLLFVVVLLPVALVVVVVRYCLCVPVQGSVRDTIRVGIVEEEESLQWSKATNGLLVYFK
jgi:ABC-type bacteriocin/lantibiotic exporter with double-glycine peptidase domain